MHRTNTRMVHSGRDDLRELGTHALPLDLSSTYPIRRLESAGASLEAFAHGAGDAPERVYARLGNPTVRRFENAMAELECLDDAVAFASGMAAITAILLAARNLGRHVIALRPLYGGTDHLLASGLLDLEVTFAEPADFERHIRSDTSLILLETPANPTLKLTDIADVCARAAHVPVLVDNTFATPVLQRPALLGAALVVHSATKYIGGHGDAMGGVVACDEAWAARLRQVRVATGAVLHPQAAYSLHRGLQTLSVRVEAAQRNAMFLAARLVDHPAVSAVYYPGLSGADPAGLIGSQMRGPGAMIAFDLVGGFDEAAQVVESVRVITPAVSLGSTDTLIQHPASLTHRVVDEDARAANAIGESMIRLSVGIEDGQDLWADLDRALSLVRKDNHPTLHA